MLGLFAGIMAVCAVLTLWIPETKGRSLDDIEADQMYEKHKSGVLTEMVEGQESKVITHS